LAVTMSMEVIVRYLFQIHWDWTYDVDWMFYSAVWLAGAAYCHVKKQHVRVDVLYNMFPWRTRAILELCFYVFAFFPFCAIMIKETIGFAAMSWHLMEGSSLTSWAPPVYPVKTLVPIAFFLLGLQGVVWFVETAVAVARKEKLG
jgi:TRAP-type mannitol/chloroaromatic compound transport system permease small subunit